MRVVCACGWEVQGSDDDVIEQTQQHGKDLHNMDVTPEQVRAMSVPEEDGQATS